MGSGRSIRKLLVVYCQQAADSSQTKPPTKRHVTLGKWSSRFHWQDRIVRQVEIETKQLAREMAEERARIARQDLDQADKLRDLVGQALEAGPTFVRRKVKRGKPKVIKDGEVIKEGEPELVSVALDTRFVVTGAKTASDLARRAAGMETEKLDVTSGGKPLPAPQIYLPAVREEDEKTEETEE